MCPFACLRFWYNRFMNQYDPIASIYENLMGDVGDLPNQYLLDPILLELLPPQANLSVLDVGCGSGRWTKILAQKYDMIIGIDNSSKMLQIAKDKRVKNNIIYQQSELEKPLSFAAKTFDLIFSNLVVHYVKNIHALAQELYRISKPGGILLVSTHHPAFYIARYPQLKKISTRTAFTAKSLKGRVFLERFYEPLISFLSHFTDAGFLLQTQKDTVITQDFIKLYPRYKKFVGLPRFIVLKFKK